MFSFWFTCDMNSHDHNKMEKKPNNICLKLQVNHWLSLGFSSLVTLNRCLFVLFFLFCCDHKGPNEAVFPGVEICVHTKQETCMVCLCVRFIKLHIRLFPRAFSS